MAQDFFIYPDSLTRELDLLATTPINFHDEI